MADPAAFIGKIPEYYDRYLGPLLFDAFADDLVARLPVEDGMRILEVACGTGIVTRRLVQRLAGRGSIIATDLNEAMFANARKGLPGPGDAKWRHADGTSLPFESRSFDAVLCQFGIMFFPDRAAGAREAFRVLRPGGRYLLSVWDALAHNPVQRLAHETIARFFPADPPQFYTVPSSCHDIEALSTLLRDAGFEEVRIERVVKEGKSPSAAEAALGVVDGNPVYAEIMQRSPAALEPIKAALAARLAAELGDGPLRAPLQAIVVEARRPPSP
ncbi:MAG TPA: methyltransferase domain-containing protein [Methylomirabilota bacterium]|nr:methyltransferase domain-containing protein [Methylomirabilota bacterium]